MSLQKILFVDRDGTLIEEPEDFQFDALHKLALLPDVIPSMLELKAAGFRFVMVTNQDGLGTPSFPQEDFEGPHQALLKIFSSQGIAFDDVLVCPHLPDQACGCRKPNIALVRDYLASPTLDRHHSLVVGDRETDLQLAKNMGLRGIRVGPKGVSWPEVVLSVQGVRRQAAVTRKTKETAITVAVDIDGPGATQVNSGIPFFDHMLEQLARHGRFGLRAHINGDLQVDEHHTVEDTALCLGQALREAVGDKVGIERYGFVLPMDEALAEAAIDLSGRPLLVFEGTFPRDTVGALPTELVSHFFRSFADSLGATLHVTVHGDNTHHMVEACFKAVARALGQAMAESGKGGLPSTKERL